MWINDKVKYTPEITTVTRGSPVEAVIETVGTDGTLGIKLPDGSIERVDAGLCELTHGV